MDRQQAENNAKIEVISREIEEKKQSYDERNRELTMMKDEVEQEGIRDLDYERKLHKAEMAKKDDEFQQKQEQDRKKYEHLNKEKQA